MYTEAVKHYLGHINESRQARCLTPGDMREQASLLQEQIVDKRGHLLKLWNESETTDKMIWQSKSKSERAALLRAVWPDIPEHHRPDILDFRKIGRRKPVLPFDNLQIFSHPQVNIEDLVVGASLLSYIESRAKNRASDFTMLKKGLSSMSLGLNCRPVSTHVGGNNEEGALRDLQYYGDSYCFVANSLHDECYASLQSYTHDSELMEKKENEIMMPPHYGFEFFKNHVWEYDLLQGTLEAVLKESAPPFTSVIDGMSSLSIQDDSRETATSLK